MRRNAKRGVLHQRRAYAVHCTLGCSLAGSIHLLSLFGMPLSGAHVNTRALFDLTGRVAIVTGGNGGIGRAIAIGLAEAGAAVAVFGRNDDKNGRVLDELKAIGRPSLAMNVDVTDRDGLEPAFLRVERELGGVDILVNNAGHANLSGGVLLENAADWDRVIEAQLNAVFLLSKLACGGHGHAAPREDHQCRQHVFVLWLRLDSLLQRRKRGGHPADQVDGHRTGAAQHSGQCHRTRLD